jgi:phosphomannomutase
VGLKGEVSSQDILGRWVEHAVGLAPKIRDLHIGYDAGNGMAGILVPELRKLTPLQIDGLYLEPDGTFPNHPANPLDFKNLEDLIGLVKQKSLDCGIAFDGDGDRAFLVDEKGGVVSGSVLGALIIERTLKANPGATILYNAIASRIVPDTIKALGGKAIRTKVGHSFIKAEMRKHDAMFACEHSGHFYFKGNYNADSGLIAALVALSIVSESSQTLSELCEPLRSKYFSSGEINFNVSNMQSALKAISEEFSDGEQDSLDGLTINYADWWLNVRPSNTEPLLRLNLEANNKEILSNQLKKAEEIIQKYID